MRRRPSLQCVRRPWRLMPCPEIYLQLVVMALRTADLVVIREQLAVTAGAEGRGLVTVQHAIGVHR